MSEGYKSCPGGLCPIYKEVFLRIRLMGDVRIPNHRLQPKCDMVKLRTAIAIMRLMQLTAEYICML